MPASNFPLRAAGYGLCTCGTLKEMTACREQLVTTALGPIQGSGSVRSHITGSPAAADSQTSASCHRFTGAAMSEKAHRRPTFAYKFKLTPRPSSADCTARFENQSAAAQSVRLPNRRPMTGRCERAFSPRFTSDIRAHCFLYALSPGTVSKVPTKKNIYPWQ